MKNIIINIILFGLVSFPTFSVSQSLNTYSRDKNTCRILKDTVVAYFVFVDTKETIPWSEYDKKSTLDSIKRAMNWIENMAVKENINLCIKVNVLESSKPIYKTMPGKSLYGMLKKGDKYYTKWSNQIATQVGYQLNISCRNKEKLMSHLRQKYQTGDVALIYMINNYYKEEISVAFNTASNNDIEFAVISYKYPRVIAHEFLHLFGANDLYQTGRSKNKNVKFIQKNHPYEVMGNLPCKIESMEMCPYTKYMIGWTDHLDKDYKKLCFVSKFKIRKKQTINVRD